MISVKHFRESIMLVCDKIFQRMARVISEKVKKILTKERTYEQNGKSFKRPFKAVLQNVSDEEVLYIYELVAKSYGEKFTVDLVKNIPEENFIYFRGTFNIDEYSGKGTIYFDSETYEIVFNNLSRIMEKRARKKINNLARGMRDK